MAPPFRWFDAFCDAGWLTALTPAALRLILAVGRRVDGHTNATRVSLKRLQTETRLPRATFFNAKRELHHHGLLQRIKEKGKRTPALILASPVPEVQTTGPESPAHWTFKSSPLDYPTTRSRPGRGFQPPADSRPERS